MKTTAKALVGWTTVAIVLAAKVTVAGPLGDSSQLWLGTAAIGQTASPSPSEDKAMKASDLLRRARQAMDESNLAAAESLVQQAEALDFQYSVFYPGDTPKKVRRDLERKRAASAPAPSNPLGLGQNKQAPNADPFAGRVVEPTAAAAQVTPLPRVDAMPAAPAAQAANGLLRDSRLALAVGDVRRAADLSQQVRAMRLNYQPLDDNPDKVDATIRKHQELLTVVDKNTEAYRRAYARLLMEQAEALHHSGAFNEAERLADRAAAIPIAYGPFEAKPKDLLDKIAASRRSGQQTATQNQLPAAQYALPPAQSATNPLDANANGKVIPAAAQFPVTTAGASTGDRYASRAVYDPANDPTKNIQVASQQAAPSQGQPTPAAPQPALQDVVSPGAPSSAMALFEQGEAALKARDTEKAYQLFQQASANSSELDPLTASRLQSHLQLLSTRVRPPAAQNGTIVDETAARQQALARQVGADVAHQEANARAMRDSDPKASLALLDETKKKVEQAGLEPARRDQLIRGLDRAIADTKQYLDQNRPQLDLAEKNKRIQGDVDRERLTAVEIKSRIAEKVDECNKLMDEQRFEEAQVVAKQAAELDPKNPIVNQLQWQVKFNRRLASATAIKDRAEDGFVRTLESVDDSKIPFDDRNPIVFPDAKEWNTLSVNRKKFGPDANKRPGTEEDFAIERKLRTPVSVRFDKTPLEEAVKYLGKLAEINVFVDPQGLAEEGVTTDTTVTIEMQKEIMLKSALNLILEPLHLSYITQDEVLKITSEKMRDGKTYPQTYNVADLVVPIPNFVPQPMGLGGAYNNAMANVGLQNGGGALPFSSSTATPASVVATHDGRGGSAAINPNVLAQMGGTSMPRPGLGPRNMPIGNGPGGLGGGAQADFDSLIELITGTLSPTSWDSAGGTGTIQPFEPNLSLVVTQTQEVHEQIKYLLEQLRRLQDLQVTIEVRFITLTDNFFERIGVSFDFDINTRTGGKGVSIVSSSNSIVGATTTNPNSAMTVGLNSPTTFSSDLGIPFTQNSYGLAVPQFGGFDATAGASLGFAILSDIEAYFFINAAQGDKRSNVLQAPKVTLFNGQQAMVMDQSQTPFVISVIPVVGDFAAAQQPVIIVLSEGTFMTVQAVVSSDRRFVRLTVVPFFSTIGSVSTFTFAGSSTTTSNSSRSGLQSAASDPSKLWNATTDQATTATSGTTVQLPTFSFVSVTTTVSVPDGGTVLLGGIKRLKEGRNEYGVPGLDKIPYINRLFRNVAVGRDTQSLMMMVTPRIIIQEEEEGKLGAE